MFVQTWRNEDGWKNKVRKKNKSEINSKMTTIIFNTNE